jgi:hypothetical protein
MVVFIIFFVTHLSRRSLILNDSEKGVVILLYRILFLGYLFFV